VPALVEIEHERLLAEDLFPDTDGFADYSGPHLRLDRDVHNLDFGPLLDIAIVGANGLYRY
jgi:hypothetical protein